MVFLMSPDTFNYSTNYLSRDYQLAFKQAIKRAYELDPVEFYVVGTEGLVDRELVEFAEATDGQFVKIPTNSC